MTATLEARTLHHVAPGDLLLERNIRDAAPSPDLVASIKSLGVLVPITAVINGDGALVVRSGHRRTLGALEAGLDTVPVYVLGLDDNTDAAEVTRIISQRDENTQRAGLTTADEVAVVEQLAAFGMSAGQMVKQARLSKARVDTALAVSGSTVAREAAETLESLTLDQAAAIAEFEDQPEIVEELLGLAVDEPEYFDHAAQIHRDNRVRSRLAAEGRTMLEADGVKVLDERPSYNDKVTALYQLVDAKTGKGITEKGHAKCPGNAAVVTGNLPDSVHVEWYCTDPKKHGHRDRYSNGSRTPAADMSEKDREDAAKARKLVIDNNKAWESASTVRRQWIAVFAKLKTAPKGTGAFLAHAVASDLQHLLDYQTNHFAAEWLGVKDPRSLHSAADGVTESRALVVALVQVLGRHEAGIKKDSWRGDGTSNAVGRYLRFLESCGYPLSDVEKFAISKKTA